MGAVLDIVALRSLTSIADAGGFRRAADTLHLSQSAVSQHVRRLEQACGRPLVQRSGRGARFTSDGEVLVAEARKILAAHDDALERIGDVRTVEQLITVGSTEHAADLLLPAITERLGSEFPDHAARFRIDRGARLAEHLEQGSIDAALFLGAVTGERARTAGVLPLRWFAAPGWQVPAGAVPLVVIDGPCTIRRRALAALADSGVETSIVCEAGHLSGVLNAARAGVGAALLAHTGPDPEGLRPVTSLPAVSPEPVHVRGRPGAPAALVDAVAAAAREILRV